MFSAKLEVWEPWNKTLIYAKWNAVSISQKADVTEIISLILRMDLWASAYDLMNFSWIRPPVTIGRAYTRRCLTLALRSAYLHKGLLHHAKMKNGETDAQRALLTLDDLIEHQAGLQKALLQYASSPSLNNEEEEESEEVEICSEKE